MGLTEVFRNSAAWVLREGLETPQAYQLLTEGQPKLGSGCVRSCVGLTGGFLIPYVFQPLTEGQ